MKNFKTRLILLLFLLACYSCASLTKSQLVEVNQFAQLTKCFSAYPQRVFTTLNDVRVKEQFFQAGTIQNPQKHQLSVLRIDTFKKTGAKLNEEAGLAFQILNDYGQKLVRLTADVYALQLDTASQSLGTNLDNLIGKYNSLAPQHAVPTGYGRPVRRTPRPDPLAARGARREPPARPGPGRPAGEHSRNRQLARGAVSLRGEVQRHHTRRAEYAVA